MPATFQDRRHIDRLLVRLVEDFNQIMAHEREKVDLILRYEREDEEYVRRETEARVDREVRRWHEDHSDQGYCEESSGEA